MILVDLSNSMKGLVEGTALEKWNVTVDIIVRFLETLSAEDTVQIVGVGMQSKVLIGPNATMPATESFVARLTRQLKKEEPSEAKSVVDFGKAIERALELLIANRSPRIAKCENVPLFSCFSLVL